MRRAEGLTFLYMAAKGMIELKGECGKTAAAACYHSPRER